MKRSLNLITGRKHFVFIARNVVNTGLQIKRIVFRGGFATILEIPYADIESVQLCNVGGLVQIIPTGIKVTLKSGKSYKLSVTKRKEILAFIQEKI